MTGVPGDGAGRDVLGRDVLGRGGELVVGDEIELDIGPVGHGGICVARAGGPGGRVVFVRYALPGERAVVRITQARPGSYCRGEAVRILSADPRRVPAPCPHFGPGGCGGCDFQHAAPELQREMKASVVAEQLRRLAGLDVPVAVEELPGSGFGWRTRVRWAVGRVPSGDGAASAGDGGERAEGAVSDGGDGAASAGDGVVGPRRYRSHDVVRLDVEAPCLIAAQDLTEAAQDLRPPPGADEVVLARTMDGPPAVTWLRRGRVLGGPRDRRSSTRHRGSPAVLRRAGDIGLPGSDSGSPGEAQGGRASGGDLVESAAGRTFAVGSTGFWQAHAHAADVLCGAVTDALVGIDLTGGTAWDLYGGVGLFAVVLAELVGAEGSVTTVEHDPEASTLAALNLRECPQVLALRSRVDAALAAAELDGSLRDPLTGPATETSVSLRAARPAPASLTSPTRGLGGPVQAVVLDPPRSGAGSAVCQAIAGRGPAVIVYVACDPAALARDTAALIGAGYRLDGLRAFDTFPQTHHVECVARFVPA